MRPPTKYRVLLVEDSPADVVMMMDYFSDTASGYEVIHVERLVEAVQRLQADNFDLILLDLGLPDSRGTETFVRMHEHAAGIPLLVLTALDDPAVGLETLQGGAQDYLVKREMRPALLSRTMRFAIERTRTARQMEETREREAQVREIEGIDRMAAEPATSVTASIYSASPLRESAPAEFAQVVQDYDQLLGYAVEERIFKGDAKFADALYDLGERLAILRAGPRDVVEIHSTVLRRRVEGAPSSRAGVFVEEGRLTVIGLMGNLVSQYRRFYPHCGPGGMS